MKKLLFLAVSASVAMSDLSLAACPNYNTLTNLPSFPTVSQTTFKHFRNQTISTLYSPYHMSHDLTLTAGESGQIVGKFDYNRVLHKDLEDEKVKAFLYGTGMQGWQPLGEYTTDNDGKILVSLPQLQEGEYAVRMVVEGDLSTTTGYVSVIDNNREAVLFDIDGTLTLNDFEEVGDYLGIRDARAYGYATDTVKAYQDKGYQIIYLSARPYWLMQSSRSWLKDNGLPTWIVHTNANAEIFQHKDKAKYKKEYIQHIQSKGIHIVRAYGNADTDIEAYAEAGIPTSNTYIIGKNGGKSGTQALFGDYSYHYSTVVMDTPNASCQ